MPKLLSKCLASSDYHFIDGVYSPLKPNAWAKLLFHEGEWDSDALYLLDGVYNGFRVVDPDAAVPIYDCKNYYSCYEGDNSWKMNNVIINELNEGKLSISLKKPEQIHALGAVPKPNGSVRHITDCSRPTKISVNNFMRQTFSSFSFNTLDKVVKDIPTGSFMCTVDLQDAYRSVPIYPGDRKHFGLRWNLGNGPAYLTDNFLCFGSRCSAYIFNRLTDAVSRYMLKNGFKCYNYLDDFILISDSYEDALTAENFLIKTLRKLGFYISWKKVTSPSQKCRFLGIDIDSVAEKLLLPDDKLVKLEHELDFWSKKTTSTKLQMQRLCGVLNFCCKVIRGGRVYMYHMIQLLKLFHDNNRITLPISFFEDLQWWKNFAVSFNGSADYFDPVNNTVELYTDACLYGLAAIFRDDFFQAKIMPCASAEIYCHATTDNAYDLYVPIEQVNNINVLELIAILLAIIRWENELRNCRVLAYCDNLQVCYNLAKDKTVNPLSNDCLRKIFWLCVQNNIYISPVYVPSKYNVDAHYLSRAIFY